MDIAKHIKPLSGEADWPVWKRKIRDLLDYHEGALNVIDSKLKYPEPLAADATEAEVKKQKLQSDLYRKANSYAKTMLTSSMTDEVYQKVMDNETAQETWEALRQLFEATSKDQLFKMCTELFTFGWTQGEDVSTHIAKLRSLWSELNNGLKVKNLNTLPDLLLVCKTLQILPDSFETFRSSWMLLTKDTERTFDELTMQLCLFERNIRKGCQGSSQEALLVKGYTQKRRDQHDKPSKHSTKEDDVCNYCKKRGHWVKTCYKWIADGKPKKKPSGIFRSTEVNTNIALQSIANETNTVEPNAEDWWIDNGATKHVTNRRDLFVDFQDFHDGVKIQSAGKESLAAIGKGTIQIISTIGKESKKMTINDVWYVPQIFRNLFSVLAAQDRNPDSQFTSTPRNCWLRVNGEVVLQGTRQVGGTLFKANIRSVYPSESEEASVALVPLLQLYHERWGHQDKRHVRSMLESHLGIKVNLDSKVCESCIYGKAHRIPFGTRDKTSVPGELISADVCGPFSESFSKKRYFVIFKDSFTKFRYGYFIRNKSEVKDVLKEMLSHAKTIGHPVKQFLSDNGGEFNNEEVRKILSSFGITQRLTAPYTPQQNGASERENRTVVEMARTFKYYNNEAKFPEAMWAELVNTAIYILNRTGKSSVVNVTPIELWIGQKPRIKHLRIVGSTCYVHVPDQIRRKMDAKAQKGYLVGYDGDERYRVYVKAEHKVILSRDVQFIENSNKSSKNQDSSNNCNTIQLPIKLIQDEDQEELIQEEDQDQEEEEINDIPNNSEVHVNSQDAVEELPQRELRDRTKLNKPKYLHEYVLQLEDPFLTENPHNFEEALASKDRAQWRIAMEKEMSSLKENNTWDLTDLPKDKKALPCKWVYRVKKNPDGSVERHKARLVVKGFKQQKGIDYNQTYSPVAKLGTIRSILSIAATEKMHLLQFDVSTAFLYGELQEVIYMQQPEGYTDRTERVCKLNKSLYGLKQAPRCWNNRFGGFLSKLGFKVSEADPCLYTKEKCGKKLLLVLYVDDGLVAATDPEELEEFIKYLKTEFKIVSKKAEYFLGLEIEYKNSDIRICQKAHASKILERFNFTECKPVSTPILKSSEISETGKENGKEHNFPYRQAVGALMYLMLGTRPDLAFSVGFLSRSLENPSLEDVGRVKRVFRYIKGTIDNGIIYHSNAQKGVFECYSDADFGGCTKTGRSTSGVVIIYGGGAISWLSQRQAMVATSTTEAEIVAANEASKEIIWITRLFKGIINITKVPVLKVDNTAAVRLAQNPEFHRRTKHISLKHFFVREKVNEGQLGIEQTSTEQQIADIMTKPLSRMRLITLSKMMGLL